MEIVLSNPRLPHALMLQLHEWRPDMLPYPGLPSDRQDAGCRRRERFIHRFTTPAAEYLEAPDAALDS